MHYFKTTAHMLFIALFSRTALFTSLFKASSDRLKGQSVKLAAQRSKRQVTGSKVNTRRTIVSTTMREWGEAVPFHFLLHSTVCVFN